MQEQPNKDLGSISGGTSKLTVQPSQKLSGHPPGPVDVEIDQIWD